MFLCRSHVLLHRVLYIISGREHLHLRLGALTLAVIAAVIAPLPVVVVPHPHAVLVVNTPHVGMTGMSGTTIVVKTVIMSAVTATMNAVIVIMSAVTANALVPVALMRGTVK